MVYKEWINRLMLNINPLGGINETDKPALERAQKADLVTLPRNVKGTNCYNCKWISEYKEKHYAFCKNKSVRQNVNGRMCCALWDAKGTYRPFEQDEKYK